MVSSFKVASRGWRTPCSQLSTAFGLTLMILAKTAWLTWKDWRMARIWRGLKGLGGGGNSLTLNPPFLPCSYANASRNDCFKSLNTLTCFFFPFCFIIVLLFRFLNLSHQSPQRFAFVIR